MKIQSTLGVLVAVLALGCSSGSSGGGSGGGAGGSGGTSTGSTSPDAYCSAVCGKDQQCDQSFDVQTCEAQCKNATAANLPKYRPEYVSGFQACYLAKDCASVLKGSAGKDCGDEVRATLAPSTAGVALCDELDSAFVKCGDGIVKAACLAFVKQYNDSTIAGAQSCVNKACSAIEACVDAQFGID